MKKILTIAGSDSSGGAGIQADLKTICAHGMYGMSVITALTAQNTLGVSGVLEVPADFAVSQLDAVFTDIMPDAVKIGMLSSAALAKTVAQKLEEYRPQFVVLDPVMVSTSGSRLLHEDAQQVLTEHLLPLCTVVTPNMLEAQALSGLPVHSAEDMLHAAESIRKACPGAVLVKGGHRTDCADDLLLDDTGAHWFSGERIENPNTHGTGCTLSSAIACALADGNSLPEAVRKAKAYLTGALRAGLDLGHGAGPLNHLYKQHPDHA